ncbi:MAG: Rieske 2Fe-2S domain-containing protein [Chloroflexi bacterium]|nr:Rieske 2Fe-2S domain-containing protein [Chloroflexota bacterium]
MEFNCDHITIDSRMRELSTALMVMILIFIVVSTGACTGREFTTVVKIGEIDDFPPGSVTQIDLPARFNDPDPPGSGSEIPSVVTQMESKLISPVPIFLVNDSSEGLIALYARNPFLGCTVKWWEPDQRFINPCHGEHYSMTGAWLQGPSPRNLDRFGVTVTDAGEVWVDLSKFQFGSAR